MSGTRTVAGKPPTRLPRPRPDLAGGRPYGAPQLDVPVRLNTNENPYPPPAALVGAVTRAVAEVAGELNRYPDREAVALRAGLAGYLGDGITGEQLWPANGSNEVLQQLLLAYGGPGRLALGFDPGYTMHRLIAQATGTRWLAVPRGRGFGLTERAVRAAIREHQPDVLVLCSPNNPTGQALPPRALAAAVDTAAGLVVVDEAYAEFSGQPSAVSLLADRPRLVVVRSMSKAFALAGARVGYAVADPAMVEVLRLVRLPYHLSALTQAVALAALRHADSTLATVRQVVAERVRVTEELHRLGWRTVPSDANFVLFGRFRDAPAAWRELLEHGVLVRDVGVPGWLRVSVGQPAENDAFLTAVAAVHRPPDVGDRGG